MRGRASRGLRGFVAALIALAVFSPHAAADIAPFGSDQLGATEPEAAFCAPFGGYPCTFAMAAADAADALSQSAAPFPGIVTTVSFRSDAPDTVVPRVLRLLPNSDLATGVSTGPSVTLAPNQFGITNSPTYMPIARGDVLGLDDPQPPTAGLLGQCFAGAGTFMYIPPLVDGAQPRPASANSVCELLMRAAVESDVDRDGLPDATGDPAVETGRCDYVHVATRGDDEILGFEITGDRIRGLAGDDSIESQAGADCLSGGGGKDKLKAEGGRDTVRAADGRRDRVNCGRAKDNAVVDPEDRVSHCEKVRVVGSG